MKWLLIISLCLPLPALAQTYQEKAVAAVLMGEAWSEGSSGMTAVAEVIHQRAMDKDKPPLQVVGERHGYYHAFSCLNGTTINHLIWKFRDEPDFQEALQIAQMTCRNPNLLPGISRNADHYTKTSEHPYWAKG